MGEAMESFDWIQFFELVRPELEKVNALASDELAATRDNAVNGAECCVLEPERNGCVAFASNSLARDLGAQQEQTVGRSLEWLLLPDDLVLSQRMNGKEIVKIQKMCEACISDSPDPAHLESTTVLLLGERRGGERFWALLRACVVRYQDHPYVFLSTNMLNIPKLEVLEGVRPTAEVRAGVEELIAECRDVVARSYSVMSEKVKKTEDVVAAWVKAGQSGAILENEMRAPVVGKDAVKSFIDKDILNGLFRESEIEMMREAESTNSMAWLVSDLETRDYPLVHISPQFETVTGYEVQWMLGRNCRFLQPCDSGRNDVFNGSERKRIAEFCSGNRGRTCVSLMLNQKADGDFFWNLLLLEHKNCAGNSYIIAASKQLTLHKELLSMMNTWDHRSLSYIKSLRELFNKREPHLSPMPMRITANEPMIAEVFTEWSESIGQDLSEFWEGDHFVPPVGGMAVKEFAGTWAPLLETAEAVIKKMHGIRDATLSSMRDNTDGGIVCAVADPTGPDCPLVFVSREFEILTGYKASFALGRNCRFLQPNKKQFNLMVNGDEVAMMRHFCSEASDFKVGSNTIHLLLNESRSGERFWNLLHMTHVDVVGRRYILAVQTNLGLPMPAFLKNNNVNSTPLEQLDPLVDLCHFLAKLRGRLQIMASQSTVSVNKLTENMLQEIVEYMKSTTDDYEGDHYVPRIGMEQARQFEMDKHWEQVFEEVAGDMQTIYQATEDTYSNTANDLEGSACCTVADASAEDCALVFVSRGFEDLTGYHRDWALGRNCRFLQPNFRAINDTYNLWERSQMREFCQLPPKPGRLLTLLVNEGRDGYAFWNALLLKHVAVEGKNYVFGVQTNVVQDTWLLAELFSGASDSYAELGRLRAILRKQESQFESFSMASLLVESIKLWRAGLTISWRFPRSELALSHNSSHLPMLGVELAKNEQQSLEEKVLTTIEDGIRHFHLNFAVKMASQTTDYEGRLFALRLVEALAILKQKHLHYLRDGLVFSIRATVTQLVGCQEILAFLNQTGYRVGLWLLDVSSAKTEEVEKAWPELDAAVRNGFVEATGLYGGTSNEFNIIANSAYVKPAVQAMDVYVGAQFGCRQWVHLNKLSQAKVVLMTCKPFGVKSTLLTNPRVKELAKSKEMDAAMFLMKWAEGLGYMCIVPFLHTPDSLPGAKPANGSSRAPTGNATGQSGARAGRVSRVEQKSRRQFVRDYTAAASAQSVVDLVKRRFPNSSLDLVRPGGDAPSPSSATSPQKRSPQKQPSNLSSPGSNGSTPGSPASSRGTPTAGTGKVGAPRSSYPNSPPMSASSFARRVLTSRRENPTPQDPPSFSVGVKRQSSSAKNPVSPTSPTSPVPSIGGINGRSLALSPSRSSSQVRSPRNSQSQQMLSPKSSDRPLTPNRTSSSRGPMPKTKSAVSFRQPGAYPGEEWRQQEQPSSSSLQQAAAQNGTEEQSMQKELLRRQQEMLQIREANLALREMKLELRLAAEKNGNGKAPGHGERLTTLPETSQSQP